MFTKISHHANIQRLSAIALDYLLIPHLQATHIILLIFRLRATFFSLCVFSGFAFVPISPLVLIFSSYRMIQHSRTRSFEWESSPAGAIQRRVVNEILGGGGGDKGVEGTVYRVQGLSLARSYRTRSHGSNAALDMVLCLHHLSYLFVFVSVLLCLRFCTFFLFFDDNWAGGEAKRGLFGVE